VELVMMDRRQFVEGTVVGLFVSRVNIPQLSRFVQQVHELESGSVLSYACVRAGLIASAAFIDPITDVSALLPRELLAALVKQHPKVQDYAFLLGDTLNVTVN
jgi:hypothetical protein